MVYGLRRPYLLATLRHDLPNSPDRVLPGRTTAQDAAEEGKARLVVDESQREALIDRVVMDPDSFGVAALHDENKSRENQGGEGR